MENFCPKKELKALLNDKFAEVHESNPELAINKLKQRIRFLKEIIDTVNASIYVNDVQNPENVWGNHKTFEEFGISLKKINKGGLEWSMEHYHPDDLGMITQNTLALQQNNTDSYNGIYRTRNSEDDPWNTHFGSGIVFRRNDNDQNWLILTISVNLSSQIDNQTQFEAMFKENRRMKNELKTACLTKREKQVLGLIGQGLTIKAISTELNLSTHTIDTHRKNLSRKIEVNNMAGLAAFAVEVGLT